MNRTRLLKTTVAVLRAFAKMRKEEKRQDSRQRRTAPVPGPDWTQHTQRAKERPEGVPVLLNYPLNNRPSFWVFNVYLGHTKG